jgi:fluoride exporter
MSALETRLNEVVAPPPVQNPDEDPLYRHVTLEEIRSQGCGNEQGTPDVTSHAHDASQSRLDKDVEDENVQPAKKASPLITQLYTLSYLILFAILGTLARLGLQAITFYPGAPIVFTSLWPNFGGSLVMGFLSEDRMLFKEEWGTPIYHQQLEKSKIRAQDEENSSSDSRKVVDLAAAKRAHLATKKTIPLYVGLATGFCGSFTSFSSFIRDAFLALSDDLSMPVGSNTPRNGGYSFMAVVAVLIITVTVSISALHLGAYLAIFLEPYTPSFPYTLTRKIIDRAAVVLAWGSWIGAVFLAIWPPDRDSDGPEIWRSRAVFALVFAPLGCLCRFYASLYLNGKIPSFPLGTFAVNIFGTMILGMSWDLQHVPAGGVVGCQVLQGVEDGFCGCLTTVSTWVSELAALRRNHAYKYGAASFVAGLCFLVVIMGSLRWTRGFSDILCIH